MVDVALVEAGIGDKAVIRALVELYMYDFSAFTGRDVDAHGFYGYRYLDHYWTEPERHPFLFRSGGCWVGFAFVRSSDVTSMSEFFVLRKYRRTGIGTAAARLLFGTFPGRWEIEQIITNPDARAFWHRAIPVEFAETATDGGWTQRFTTVA